MKIVIVVVVIFCSINIILLFINGIKKMDFGKEMDKKLFAYSGLLLAALLYATISQSAKVIAGTEGNYLFTSDEHYFRYEIEEINDISKGIFTNETYQEYKSVEGETIIVDKDSLVIKDVYGDTIYSNTGGKIVVVKE